jgi:hypothetical protein
MLSQIIRPSECRCVLEYDGDFFAPSKIEGKVCDAHKEAGLTIVEVHGKYVDMARERIRLNTEIHKLADKTPSMRETLMDTEIGTLRVADVLDAQAYSEDEYPRKEVLKAEYVPAVTLKEDGSFEVKLPETDKKAELEVALRK